MAEFYFTASIANGYEYRNTPDNYRHFLMELPVNKEELTYIFKEIGLELDAKPGEYIFEITDFYLPGVNAKRLFKETENIDELNYLADILSNLDGNEYRVFTAAVKAQEHTRSVADLINLALNTEVYNFIPDISDYDDYGRYKAEESGINIDELGDLEEFIDFWQYGEQCKRDNKAVFLDSGGVLEKNYYGFPERYNGDLHTIPKEFSITTDALSDIELEETLELSVLIDRYLREHHPDYDRMYSDIFAIQKDISDNLLLGKTHKLKQLFGEMSLTENDTPAKELSDYEKKYPKRLFMIYQLKDDDSTRGLRFESLEQIKKDKQLPVIENYELIYSARMKADTTLESIFTEFNTNRPYDFYGHSLSVSDIVVLSDKGKNNAYYCDKASWKKVDKFFDYVHTRSAAISNYKGMTAFVGCDDKLYLGKSENYIFGESGFAYYDNRDKSLTYITDNLTLYPFLYGSGWVCTQQEMLDNGSFTKEIYAEYDRLQKGVLSQFEQIRELKFADKPFNYLETAEKQTEQNYNKIDGIINNEPPESEDKNMDDKISVLAVEPMKEPYVKEINPGLDSLQKEVGGLIQATYPYDDMVAIICNDEGKLNGLPLNRAIYNDDKEMTDIIAGTFLIVGLGEENFTSLSDGLQKKYANIFKNPEEFVRIGNEIVAIPVKPSIKQQLNQAKKEQGEREDKKPPSHKPPEL
mgnify:FL=1